MNEDRTPLRVIIWGFGAMGSGMARLLLEKQGALVTGVCDLHPERVGRSMYEILGVPRGNRPEVIVTDRIESILCPGCADIALLATDSFVARAFTKIVQLLENRINVISTAEEMVWPRAADPALAEELDRTARRNGVSVLGTGINPGLIMDLLVLMMTGACGRVDTITARRVNSLSPFGPAVMEEQGVGLSLAEFHRKAAEGAVAGHVGFAQSVSMICEALGWNLDSPVGFEQSMTPIVSSVSRSTPHATVEPGMVAGSDMTGAGMVDGERRIIMEHPQQIEPAAEGVATGDFVSISGEPSISLAIQPEIPGGIGTIAMCVNMIPQVMNAEPGLMTMLDLPVPRAIMGDLRDRIRRRPAATSEAAPREPAAAPGDAAANTPAPAPATNTPSAARPGDWVEITRILLAPAERADALPEQTARVPLVMRVRGFLRSAPAAPGDEVEIETVTGRKVRGTVCRIEPSWDHGFGDFVPELLEIGRRYRDILFGGGSSREA